MNNRPFYHKLYSDLIRDKFPEKETDLKQYLKKKNWTALDVIQVNEFLFGADKDKQDQAIDKKHRAYDQDSIKQILLYQKKNKLSNTALANRYGLSRNSIAKWKKLFPEHKLQRLHKYED